MEQIFNELSVNNGYPDKYAAKDGFEKSLKLSARMCELGFDKTIRTTKGFAQRNLTDNFSIYNWATDRLMGCDRDLQRYFLVSATKAPFIEDFFTEHEDKGSLVEFKCSNEKALGLGLAYLWRTFVLSLDCDEQFCNDKIELNFISLSNEATGDENIEVLSIWSPEQVNRLEPQLRSILRNPIKTGKELIDKLCAFFPNLQLGLNTVGQLKHLTGNEQFFQEIVRHFEVLNDTMQQWIEGPFLVGGISWSTESESTMQKFGNQRDFVCSDGISRRFSLHSKLISANKRIYFFPIPENKTVHIGYIGDHLPTTKYKA